MAERVWLLHLQNLQWEEGEGHLAFQEEGAGPRVLQVEVEEVGLQAHQAEGVGAGLQVLQVGEEEGVGLQARQAEVEGAEHRAYLGEEEEGEGLLEYL